MDTQPTKKSQRAEKKFKKFRLEPLHEQKEHIEKKPAWLKTKLTSNPRVKELTTLLREANLVTVCEEATCPNLHECFGRNTATFMIMGDICTRTCRFCDVKHGKPRPLDTQEPYRLAETIAKMKLRYVVITSVDRDDLTDAGASHFVACIEAIRKSSEHIEIEILTPDFKGKDRMPAAIKTFERSPPDVFNHNIETVERLYKQARPASNYHHSLMLLKKFKENFTNIPTKSGLMLGLGENRIEVIKTLNDLKEHKVDRITLGQYLSPSKHHLPVAEYITPETFEDYKQMAYRMGFEHVASGPLVRSSYHADINNALVEQK